VIIDVAGVSDCPHPAAFWIISTRRSLRSKTLFFYPNVSNPALGRNDGRGGQNGVTL